MTNWAISPPPPRKNSETLQKYVSKRKKMVDMFVARNQLADSSLFYILQEYQEYREKFWKRKKIKFYKINSIL